MTDGNGDNFKWMTSGTDDVDIFFLINTMYLVYFFIAKLVSWDKLFREL